MSPWPFSFRHSKSPPHFSAASYSSRKKDRSWSKLRKSTRPSLAWCSMPTGIWWQASYSNQKEANVTIFDIIKLVLRPCCTTSTKAKLAQKRSTRKTPLPGRGQLRPTPPWWQCKSAILSLYFHYFSLLCHYFVIIFHYFALIFIIFHFFTIFCINLHCFVIIFHYFVTIWH